MNTDKKELISFDEWQDIVSFADYIPALKNTVNEYFRKKASETLKKGEILATVTVFLHWGFSYVEELVTKSSANAFISDSLDDLEEIIMENEFSISSIDLAFGEEAEIDYEFNVPDFFYTTYKCEMLASGYSEEEIEESNEVDF